MWIYFKFEEPAMVSRLANESDGNIIEARIREYSGEEVFNLFGAP